jgi:hypothetical protein
VNPQAGLRRLDDELHRPAVGPGADVESEQVLAADRAQRPQIREAQPEAGAQQSGEQAVARPLVGAQGARRGAPAGARAQDEVRVVRQHRREDPGHRGRVVGPVAVKEHHDGAGGSRPDAGQARRRVAAAGSTTTRAPASAARRPVSSAEPLSTTITSSTAPKASRTTPAIVASSSRAGITATRCIVATAYGPNMNPPERTTGRISRSAPCAGVLCELAQDHCRDSGVLA